MKNNPHQKIINESKSLLKREKYEEMINILQKGLEQYPTSWELNKQIGAAYYLKSDFNASLEFTKKAIKLNPTEPSLYNNLALLYKEKNNFKLAEIFFKKAFQLNPDDQTININWGELYYDNDNIDKAIELFENVLKINPENSYAFVNLGHCFYFRNAYEQALSYYQKADILKPNDFYINYLLGDLLKILKRYSESLAYLEKSKSINNKFQHTSLSLGSVYVKLNDFDKAKEAFSEASNDIETSLEAFLYLGDIYFSEKKYEEALGCYKKAYVVDKNNVAVKDALIKVYYELAAISYDLAHYKKSIEYAEKVLKIKPNDSITLVNIAETYLQMGDIENLNKIIEKLKETKETTPHINYLMSQYYYYKKMYREALKLSNDLIKNSLYIKESYLLKGYILLKQSKTEEAISNLKEALNHDKSCLNAYYGLAAAYSANKEFENAIDCINTALSINNKIPEFYKLLFQIYEKSGELKLAQKYRSTYKKLNDEIKIEKEKNKGL